MKSPNKFKKTPKKKNARKSYSLLYQASPSAEERKNTDQLISFLTPALSAWGNGAMLNVIIQGTSATAQRIGRKVTMTSLLIRYNVLRTGDNGPSQCRIVVIYDRQPTGVMPSATDVFAADYMVSPLNLSNSERFVVIIDELTDSFQSTSLNISGMRYRKMGLPAIYSGNGGDIAAIKTGAVYVFAANNGDQAGANTLTIDMATRIRYTDA